MKPCHVNIQSIFGLGRLTTQLTGVIKERGKVNGLNMVPGVAAGLVRELGPDLCTLEAHVLGRLFIKAHKFQELRRIGSMAQIIT